MTEKTVISKEEFALIQQQINELAAAQGPKKKIYKQRSRMTVGEVLDLPIALLSLPLVAFLALLTGPLRGRKQRRNPKQGVAKSLLLHVGYAVLRRVVSRFSPLQVQAVTPSTSDTYKLYVRLRGVKNNSVDLGNGASGHWLGDPKAKNVLIWIHGGGFAVPANHGYFIFFDRFLKDQRAAGKDIAVFATSYTLAPRAVYPTPVRQSVIALRYILEQTGHKAENVYLGGDSAGGNLVLGVLSHLLHPHPEIEPLSLPEGEELGGIALFSPWTSLETTFPPIEPEALGDFIHPKCAGPWAGSYLADSERDNYTDPRLAPIPWWHGAPVKRVLITGGGYELLLPFIEDFAAKFIKAVGADKVEYFQGPGEAHVAPMFNLFLGDMSETEQGKKLKSFFREVVN